MIKNAKSKRRISKSVQDAIKSQNINTNTLRIGCEINPSSRLDIITSHQWCDHHIDIVVDDTSIPFNRIFIQKHCVTMPNLQPFL